MLWTMVKDLVLSIEWKSLDNCKHFAKNHYSQLKDFLPGSGDFKQALACFNKVKAAKR